MAANTVQCSRCGALIGIAQLAPTAICAHCGHQQQLDAQRVAQLQHYQQSFASDMQAAATHRAHAAQADAVQRRVGRYSSLWALLLMIGLPAAVALIGVLLITVGVIPNKQGPWVSFAAIGACMVGMVVYFIGSLVSARRAETGATAGTTTIACPECGAAHTYQRGQALDRCDYCTAALMPSATVIQDGLDVARAQRRRAQMEHWRNQRSMVVSFQNAGMKRGVMVFIWFGPLGLMMGVTAVGLTFQMAFGDEPYSHGIFALWAMVVGGVAALGYGYRWSKDRKRELRNGSVALAYQLHGHTIETLDWFVQWLNSFWAAEYDISKLNVAGFYGGAHGTIDGYAVLAECSASSDKYRPKRVQLFVAAHVPGVSDGGQIPTQFAPAVEQQRQWLKYAGYVSHVSEGGVRLEADEPRVEQLCQQLDQIAQLAPVLHHACMLARALGAVPVAALPL